MPSGVTTVLDEPRPVQVLHDGDLTAYRQDRAGKARRGRAVLVPFLEPDCIAQPLSRVIPVGVLLCPRLHQRRDHLSDHVGDLLGSRRSPVVRPCSPNAQARRRVARDAPTCPAFAGMTVGFAA